MRYNGWHYLPHSSGMHHRAAERDWFFAPTMSDVTDWSGQHHTGHVALGVRYAIRVPCGIELAGANRPGVHDFRLMRALGEGLYDRGPAQRDRHRRATAGLLPVPRRPL